jgi:hypothetical protein
MLFATICRQTAAASHGFTIPFRVQLISTSAHIGCALPSCPFSTGDRASRHSYLQAAKLIQKMNLAASHGLMRPSETPKHQAAVTTMQI